MMIKNVIQRKNVMKISVNVSVKNPLKYHVCKKYYVWNPSTCDYEINKCLKNYADVKGHIIDWLTTGDEITELQKLCQQYKMDFYILNTILDTFC